MTLAWYKISDSAHPTEGAYTADIDEHTHVILTLDLDKTWYWVMMAGNDMLDMRCNFLTKELCKENFVKYLEDTTARA